VLVENSVIRGNAVGVQANPSATASVTIDHSVLESNTISNLFMGTSTATAVLQASTIAGAPAAITNTVSAAVISYGNNFIRNPGAPTSTVALQ